MINLYVNRKETSVMKRIFWCLFLFLFAVTLAYANLQSGADKLINQLSPNLNIGVEVIDLTTGTTLYRRNANRTFIPASNMKLFSDAAALMVLGPDYRFSNQLFTNASQVQQGSLRGSLFLRLPGDPSFSHERLMLLLNRLQTWQIKRIKGNVYLDSSHALVDPYPPGWLAEDRIYSYAAPIAPVMIDTNRLMVTVNPAAKINEPAIIETNDSSGSISIENHVLTKTKATACGVSFSLDEKNNLVVRGCVLEGQWAIQQEIAIRNPMAYAQGVIKKQLASLNITLEGEVLLGKVPAGALLIASELSKPISQLMADTLKPSDNLYADSLFLHVAEKLRGNPVNWNDAQASIKHFLQQQTGIQLSNAVLTDGSGLSRKGLITPSQTAALLRFLHDKFPLSYEYIAALPVSGRDGTLQKRFKKPTQQDLVRAKTGTMKGIVSLSGYLYTANAHTLAFAIFINNVRGTQPSIRGKYRYLVDALCSYFLQQQPKNGSWANIFRPHGRLRFQQNPTQAELQRNRKARWRQLESEIKRAFRGQAVTIIFRGNELILRDNQLEVGRVFSVLKKLRAKYPFAVALLSRWVPTGPGIKPFVLWIEALENLNAQRVWILREAAFLNRV